MDNENVNVDNKNESVDAPTVDAPVMGDVERQEVEKMDINDGNSVRSQEQLNMDKYTHQIELASYFPNMEERCINMSRMCHIKPIPGVNTGAVSGDTLHVAGMELLTAIKKEIFDSKPEWEKECIKEGRIAGARLDDESFEDDGITPQDGRPRLTVEYLRSIGYDIDIS